MSASLFDLTSKTALVTGASRGLGLAIAEAYARAGARVAISARHPGPLQAAAARLRAEGGDVLAIPGHAARAADVERLVEATVETFGGLDVAVANAATSPHFGPLLEASEVLWDNTLELNAKGFFLLARAAAPRLATRSGSLIALASIAGLLPHRNLGLYGVSKAALVMAVKTLAVELAPRVRVNAIAPGIIETQFSRALWEGPGERARREHDIPLGRLGTPAEVVGLALYLASEASSFTTGAVLVVDGGQSIGGNA